MKKTILIMAGGTGGHIFPALAVADKMRDSGWRVVWLGNPNGMEARLVPEHGYELVGINFSALRGKGLRRLFTFPFDFLRALWQAMRAMKRLQPNVVLGMGGYISAPGGVVAKLLGIPLVVHEQNSVAGMANRWLVKWAANRVAQGFPDVFPQGQWLGNPVRKEICDLGDVGSRYREREGALRILVVGGSLGAQALNTMIPAGMALIDPAHRPQIVHQAGEKHLQALQDNYTAAGVHAHCVAFIADMAGAYEWADLVICRAGALTLAEITAAGVASVLVPFPYAVDDHQTVNAKQLKDIGAAILQRQDELSAQWVANVIPVMRREHLLEMAMKARTLAKPNAAGDVATLCAEVAR